MNGTNEELQLQDLLKEDKEMLLENMAKDRAPEAVRVLLENEIDRIAYRCSDIVKDERRARSAQTYLRVLKNALPFISSVSEVREWKRSVNSSSSDRKVRPIAAVAAIAGIALIIIPLISAMLSRGGELSFKTLLIAVAGAACLFFGGLFFKPKTKVPKAEAELKQEFLVDPGAVYQSLWGAFIITDKCIEDDMALDGSHKENSAARTEGLPEAEIELLSGLLETAYTCRGQENHSGNEEIISGIRYYLHNHNIEIADYSEGQENMFEILPSRRAGTIRPALVSGGKIIKKGLASSARE